MIRTPLRTATPDENDFFFRVPFTKTIDLSAYSVQNEDLKYSLHSMAFTLGRGFTKDGHSVAIVLAADGRYYKIDNQSVEHVLSPGPFVDRAQSEVITKDFRMLPTFFVYARQREGGVATAAVAASGAGAAADKPARSSRTWSSSENENKNENEDVVLPRRNRAKRLRSRK